MNDKYLRTDMFNAITLYCNKNGFRILYLNKLTKIQLEQIIIKYDINMNELLLELRQKRELEENNRLELEAEIKKKTDTITGKLKMLNSLLNNKQKEKFKEYCNSLL